jgi:polyhydroxyalkanoate synthesis regulator phasin
VTTPQEQAEQVTSNALAVINDELAALFNWSIENDEDNGFAAEMLRDVKARHKALEEKRKTITQPLAQAKKAVDDLFRQPRELLEQAEACLKAKIAGYLEACQQANAAALAAVVCAETPEQASEALATIQPTAEAPAGVSVRYKWRAIVFSPEIVPDAFLSPDEAKIQAFTDQAVKTHGKPTPISGVRFEQEAIVSSRAKVFP